MISLPHQVHTLRKYFQAEGFDIRIVGGAVRDHFAGICPKDIDFATDANPEEQISIYTVNGISYHETGLQHGTITVVLDGEPYEITSLRTETNHNGRHADVEYTRDWIADLGRRDLTINAISMTLDGDVIDPFGGRSDLTNGIVRFVGDANDRIQEDYLRILRWFRFQDRFGNTVSQEIKHAIIDNRTGLHRISKERIWSEMSRLLMGNDPIKSMKLMTELKVNSILGLHDWSEEDMYHAVYWGNTKNPVTVMVAMMGDRTVRFPMDWRWSAAERNLSEYLMKTVSTDYVAEMAVHGHSNEWVSELARLNGSSSRAQEVLDMTVPVFPVRGKDLIDYGMKPGPEISNTMKAMKLRWSGSDYKMSKEELIQTLDQ